MRTIIGGLIFGIYMLLFYLNTIGYNRVKAKGTQEDVDKFMFKIGKRWARNTLKITGTTVEIHGEENVVDGPCLFVSNHQSYMDIPIIVSIAKSHLGFVAKKELAEVPLFGIWIKRTRSLFLDRENTREAIKVILEGVNYLKEGHSLCIFPEGTRSKSNNVGSFKKGSLKLALKSGVPIVPVTIDGAYKILEENNRLRKAHVIVTVDKPIYTEGMTKEEQNDLIDEIKSKIVKNLEQNNK
ncbi:MULTISPECIES: lysophospholipid acyltransferase family protein [Clostridium]|uniref:1-acyl-sn-glycerol-3-phosphate acyltransferase n=1 Tax=Clostridium cadaveris TaxID=1529 RepID=A0A1I2JIM8_9CLOT|nr:lysophospholipid acyltransferase family protein [Clostridium cadaveris]MDU4951248.1 lysophospholipid acyltransferase family protein [Clostridium sp.]MDM8312289.1 lysophospholipid acyltransferase family protein [Clostridium cadaveris]MDY4947849.1 lysophospholipid acyltransferase family protein [Clostridium cadaveris]NME63908.1 1-acyl-sn-glycerol-3-phosphate acyltransferase [Clostridium cadaveris]NWK10515.1 1-acyl-sn-glycerol-3-phosphate acyltransferase [Clostridium cadaveris]